jgi:peptide/nickel transport system substrate-binding protein
MADVLYTVGQGFDRVLDEDKSKVEFALAVTSKPFLDTVRGIRVISPNKLEVYVDYWHFVDDYIAEYANMSSVSMPWEIMAAMDKLVFEDRRAAYTDTASQRFSVPWLNLVMSNDARLLRRALIKLRDNNNYPKDTFESAGVSVSNKDAIDRYQAALDWIDKFDMAVISNGPFKLTRYDPPSQFAEIVAFRDQTYPFKPGDWYKGSPPQIKFSRVDSSAILIGSPSTINLTVDGPGEINVRYLLMDPSSGNMLTKGVTNKKGNEYTLTIPSEVTGEMVNGIYHLFLVGSSDKVSSLAERRVDMKASSTKATPTKTDVSSKSESTETSTSSKKNGGFSCSGPPLISVKS